MSKVKFLRVGKFLMTPNRYLIFLEKFKTSKSHSLVVDYLSTIPYLKIFQIMVDSEKDEIFRNILV